MKKKSLEGVEISLEYMCNNQFYFDSVEAIANNFVINDGVFDLNKRHHLENNVLVCASPKVLSRSLDKYQISHFSGSLLPFYKSGGYVVIVLGEGDKFDFLVFDKTNRLIDFFPK